MLYPGAELDWLLSKYESEDVIVPHTAEESGFVLRLIDSGYVKKSDGSYTTTDLFNRIAPKLKKKVEELKKGVPICRRERRATMFDVILRGNLFIRWRRGRLPSNGVYFISDGFLIMGGKAVYGTPIHYVNKAPVLYVPVGGVVERRVDSFLSACVRSYRTAEPVIPAFYQRSGVVWPGTIWFQSRISSCLYAIDEVSYDYITLLSRRFSEQPDFFVVECDKSYYLIASRFDAPPIFRLRRDIVCLVPVSAKVGDV